MGISWWRETEEGEVTIEWGAASVAGDGKRMPSFCWMLPVGHRSGVMFTAENSVESDLLLWIGEGTNVEVILLSDKFPFCATLAEAVLVVEGRSGVSIMADNSVDSDLLWWSEEGSNVELSEEWQWYGPEGVEFRLLCCFTSSQNWTEMSECPFVPHLGWASSNENVNVVNCCFSPLLSTLDYLD